MYAAVQSILADMTSQMPADSDVVGAQLSLVRIQTTYDLSVSELISGQIAGRKAVAPLSQQTVFDVAVLCLGNGQPDIAMRWLHQIRNTSTIPASSVYQAFARAFAQVIISHLVDYDFIPVLSYCHRICLCFRQLLIDLLRI